MAFQSEMELLAALKDSEFWKYIVGFLDDRRETVFAKELSMATTHDDVCKAQGKISEITLLKNLPNLILAKVMADIERRREEAIIKERQAEGEA